MEQLPHCHGLPLLENLFPFEQFDPEDPQSIASPNSAPSPPAVTNLATPPQEYNGIPALERIESSVHTIWQDLNTHPYHHPAAPSEYACRQFDREIEIRLMRLQLEDRIPILEAAMVSTARYSLSLWVELRRSPLWPQGPRPDQAGTLDTKQWTHFIMKYRICFAILQRIKYLYDDGDLGGTGGHIRIRELQHDVLRNPTMENLDELSYMEERFEILNHERRGLNALVGGLQAILFQAIPLPLITDITSPGIQFINPLPIISPEPRSGILRRRSFLLDYSTNSEPEFLLDDDAEQTVPLLPGYTPIPGSSSGSDVESAIWEQPEWTYPNAQWDFPRSPDGYQSSRLLLSPLATVPEEASTNDTLMHENLDTYTTESFSQSRPILESEDSRAGAAVSLPLAVYADEPQNEARVDGIIDLTGGHQHEACENIIYEGERHEWYIEAGSGWGMGLCMPEEEMDTLLVVRRVRYERKSRSLF